MSGRGRGRGRGIPLSYPDGLTTKPILPVPSASWMQPPPPPPLLDAEVREILYLKRRLFNMKASREFRVSTGVDDREFARYSDRYLDAPIEPFHKSSARSIREGIHFTSELMPPKKGDAAKKKAAAAAAAGGRGRGSGAAASSSSTGKGDKGKGKKVVAGELAKRLRTLEEDDEDDDGDEAKGKKARKSTTIKDDEEDADDDGEDEQKKETEGEEGEGLEDLEDDEEEDILNDDDQYDFGDGFEDGMDDVDSGGEDEPTY